MIKIRKKGFTIIELLIALAIMSVLVALALPSFHDALRKSRRADGMDAILSLHLAQARFRANSPVYGSLAELGIAVSPMPSEYGHYELIINLPFLPAARATEYTITARAKNDQVDDYCGDFTLSFIAGVITKTTSTGTAAVCWKK